MPRGWTDLFYLIRRRGCCDARLALRFKTILELILPANWFLPVTPGTQFVTVGGAIANDVHGKNHHRAGSFGCHLQRFELLRSDRGKVLCSRECNRDLFEATIGGLGLTGLILWAEFQLKRISGPLIDCEKLRFETLEEFFELSASSDKDYEYTVAWLDCMSTGNKRNRGIFIRGNHSAAPGQNSTGRRTAPTLPGFHTPGSLISRPTVRAFNWMYLHSQLRQSARIAPIHFEKFFYPLDRVADWNRFYGKTWISTVPISGPVRAKRSRDRNPRPDRHESREVCSLSVLKIFGDDSISWFAAHFHGPVLLSRWISRSRESRPYFYASNSTKWFRNMGERSIQRRMPACPQRASRNIFPRWSGVFEPLSTHVLDPISGGE